MKFGFFFFSSIEFLCLDLLMCSMLDLQVLVLFCGPQMVKVNVIRGIATQIVNKDTLSRLILVVQNKITSQALKAVDLFSFKVEIFQVNL